MASKTASSSGSSAQRGAPRPVVSVDLGDMKQRVAEVCAAAGLRQSDWLRALVWRELGGEAANGPATPSASSPGPNAATQAQESYQAVLDPELTAKLDVIKQRGGFRTRASALRGVIEGINVSGAGASLDGAVTALGQSNHLLVSIARSCSDIARAQQAGAGALKIAERLALDQAVDHIHRHLGVAAHLVSDLRPMLKTKKGKSP